MTGKNHGQTWIICGQIWRVTSASASPQACASLTESVRRTSALPTWIKAGGAERGLEPRTKRPQCASRGSRPGARTRPWRPRAESVYGPLPQRSGPVTQFRMRWPFEERSLSVAVARRFRGAILRAVLAGAASRLHRPIANAPPAPGREAPPARPAVRRPPSEGGSAPGGAPCGSSRPGRAPPRERWRRRG